jgi:hypothetical protein
MKAKEMVGGASALSWDSVLRVVTEGAPEGFTNHELAASFAAEYARVASLTKLMYEAGALSRVQTGRTAGTTLYFLPV